MRVKFERHIMSDDGKYKDIICQLFVNILFVKTRFINIQLVNSLLIHM